MADGNWYTMLAKKKSIVLAMGSKLGLFHFNLWQTSHHIFCILHDGLVSKNYPYLFSWLYSISLDPSSGPSIDAANNSRSSR